MELHLPCLVKVGQRNNGYKTIQELLPDAAQSPAATSTLAGVREAKASLTRILLTTCEAHDVIDTPSILGVIVITRRLSSGVGE
jgi:hypothetical protein